MPIFYIRHGITGTDRDTWEFVADRDGNPLEYGDGKSAATAKEALGGAWERERWSIPEAHSLFIYREPDAGEGDAQWQEREAARFASGRYKPLPWADDPELTTPPEHFAHIAESNAQKVAFTETDAKGRADKQKVASAADYLQAYVIGDRDRKAYYVSVMLGLSTEVHFADTSDAIEAAYVEMAGYSRSNGDYAGVLSCMTYRTSHFGNVHPVRTYGAGDLALAYIRAEAGDDAPGSICARALVWPEKGICGRVYGPGASTLRGALRAQGFGEFDDCALVGARLLAIPHPNDDPNCYVMPYIDGHHRFKWGAAKEHFVISEDGFEAANTGGYAYTYNACECERCGDTVREDNTREVDGDTWCNDCASEYARTCDHCQETSSCDHSEVIAGAYIAASGRRRFSFETWCEHCLENGATYSEAHSHYIADGEGETCDHCSEFFLPDELRDFGDIRVCSDCHDDLAPDDDDANDDAPAAPVDVPAPVQAPAPVDAPRAYASDVPAPGCNCSECASARADGLPDVSPGSERPAPIAYYSPTSPRFSWIIDGTAPASAPVAE
jgi:hypothetical protein